MPLKKAKERQQAQRRGAKRHNWKLFESDRGKVPKELVKMFAGIQCPQIVNPPRPVLTPVENAQLKASLDFIERHGISRLIKVIDPDGQVPPTIKPIKGTIAGLKELKIASSTNNPRFIFAECNQLVVFLDAFAKKQSKLLKRDINRSEQRYKTLKNRGDC